MAEIFKLKPRVFPSSEMVDVEKIAAGFSEEELQKKKRNMEHNLIYLQIQWKQCWQ